jgi:signal transduction histidine kinase
VLKEDISSIGVEDASAQIAAIESDGTLVNANDAWRSMAIREGLLISGALPGHDFLTMLREFQAPKDAARSVLKSCKDALSGAAEGFSAEYAVRLPEGPRRFEMRGVRVRSGGKPRLVLFHKDVTGPQPERPVAQPDSRPADIPAAPRDAVQAAGPASSGRQMQFLSAVSHELKSPLTAIVAFTEVLGQNRDRTLTARQLDHIRVIQQNTQRMYRLVNDLLDLARLESSTFSLKVSEFDLSEAISEVVSSVQPVLDGRRQRISASCRPEHIRIEADRDRVVQVLTNLVDNASKYSAHNMPIEVAAATAGDSVTISVSDRGTGIPEDALAHIFEPFYRVEGEATRSVQGTGLGLPIVKKLVEMHRGSVEVSSAVRKGTTVRVLLPLRRTPPPPAAE